MAIEIYERFDSAKTVDRVGGTGSTAEFSVILQGSDVEADLRQALRIYAPPAYFNLVIQDVQIESQIAPGTWTGKVRYGWPDDDKTQEPPNTGDALFSFDTTGGTTHISQSKGTTAYGELGQGLAWAPDYGSAINVSKDGVAGVDIITPQLKFTTTAWMPASFVTQDWVTNVLYELTGQTNDATWKKFPRGDLLFLGASGQRRGRGDWEITFSFAAEKGFTDRSIGPIPLITKRGHQYLWFAYQQEVNDTGSAGKFLVHRPIAAYVETVYDEGDFSKLGLGT